MANFGTVVSGSGEGGLYIVCSWNISNIDNDAGTANLNWRLYVDGGGGSNTSYVVHGYNYFNVNGATVFAMGNGSGDSRGDPVNMYTPYWNNKGEPEYQRSGYTFTPCWIWRHGELSSGSRQVTYNDEGRASIRLDGYFLWYYSSGGVWLDSGWVQLDQIERYNKAQSSSNKGSNWSKDKYFWKSTDWGHNWKKVKGYKTTNGTSASPTWTKV